jgi:hypothetical protein
MFVENLAHARRSTVFKGVGSRCPQNRATGVANTFHLVAGEGYGLRITQALVATNESDKFMPVNARSLEDGTSNHSVQAGGISATR